MLLLLISLLSVEVKAANRCEDSYWVAKPTTVGKTFKAEARVLCALPSKSLELYRVPLETFSEKNSLFIGDALSYTASLREANLTKVDLLLEVIKHNGYNELIISYKVEVERPWYMPLFIFEMDAEDRVQKRFFHTVDLLVRELQ